MITSTLGRMASADKLSVQQLKQAVQDGTVPAYIGIPLLQEKLKQSQQAMASQAGQAPQQPPIADQIMQQAAGIPALQSNLPEQYAHGGVIHLAGGGYDPMAMARAYTHDEEDPEDMDFLNALGADQMPEMQEPEGEPEYQNAESDAGGIADLAPVSTLAYAAPYATTRQADQVTVKQEGEPAQTVRKETARVERPAAVRDLERLALAEGEKYKLDPSLIKHVLLKETGGLKDRAGAVSSAGAMGVMQLMPATARELGVKDPFDPVQNIEGGVKYLAQMQNKYGDPRLAAIAYNWGPGRTDRWLAQGGDFSKLPKETQGYIRGLSGGGRPEDMDSMTDDDTDGLTVNVSNLGGGSDYDADQMAGFNIDQMSNAADSNIVSDAYKPIPSKKQSSVGKVLEKSGISDLANAARERYYETKEDEKRLQASEDLVPSPFEALTPEERASRKANAELLRKGPQNVTPLTKEEMANLEASKAKQKFNRSGADSDVKTYPAAPLQAPELGGQRSIATNASVQEALDALNEQPKPAAVPVEAKDTGYSDLKDYFTKGIAGL
jgi:hypothetical protein